MHISVYSSYFDNEERWGVIVLDNRWSRRHHPTGAVFKTREEAEEHREIFQQFYEFIRETHSIEIGLFAKKFKEDQL